jgi:nucleoid-associated protein EbfC
MIMNMSDLMKQAQQFQEKLATVQNELGNRQVTGSAGAGMVTATFNGKGELLDLTIEKELVQQENAQMLQDLVIAAVNDGLNKARDLGKSEMARLTGGLNIPGLM